MLEIALLLNTATIRFPFSDYSDTGEECTIQWPTKVLSPRQMIHSWTRSSSHSCSFFPSYLHSYIKSFIYSILPCHPTLSLSTLHTQEIYIFFFSETENKNTWSINVTHVCLMKPVTGHEGLVYLRR